MIVNDFITYIGDLLGEDFIYAPTWTRSEILSYLQESLRKFAELTMLVDQDSLRYIVPSTGESSVPRDFINANYVMYDEKQIDIVQLGELDFVTGDWMLGTSGSAPLGATIIGTGSDAVVRLVPVPTSTSSPYGYTVVTSVVLEDAGGSFWQLGVDTTGATTTTPIGAGPATSVVLPGPTTYWTLSVDVAGVVTTVATTVTDSDTVILADANGAGWSLYVDDDGLLTTNRNAGKVVRIEVDGVNQEFTSNNGIITNAYATGVTTTPSAVVRLTKPYGTTTYGRVSDGTVHVYYKALMDDVPNSMSEIHLNDCYLPVIQHGVLALAYNHDGQGRDKKKAKMLDAVFRLECGSIRRVFNKK